MLVPGPYSFLKMICIEDINMFASFNEIAAMTLQDIKETKHHGRREGQLENSIYFTNTVCVCVCVGGV